MSYQQYIAFLQDSINNCDNDTDMTMLFWRNPSQKAKLVHDMLHMALMKIDKLDNEHVREDKVSEIMKWLDNKWDAFAWPCHDTHFHTDFREYVICPFTCLNEIVTCLEKIQLKMFRE